MKLYPYLSFKGNCEEALNFYEKALGAKVCMKMRFGESPMTGEMPKEVHNQIMHARFMVGTDVIMASDAPCNFTGQSGFAISINVDTAAEADRYFNALSENGEITMPIGETFWAHRFGMLKDQFGVMWMVNCEKSA